MCQYSLMNDTDDFVNNVSSVCSSFSVVFFFVLCATRHNLVPMKLPTDTSKFAGYYHQLRHVGSWSRHWGSSGAAKSLARPQTVNAQRLSFPKQVALTKTCHNVIRMQRINTLGQESPLRGGDSVKRRNVDPSPVLPPPPPPPSLRAGSSSPSFQPSFMSHHSSSSANSQVDKHHPQTVQHPNKTCNNGKSNQRQLPPPPQRLSSPLGPTPST